MSFLLQLESVNMKKQDQEEDHLVVSKAPLAVWYYKRLHETFNGNQNIIMALYPRLYCKLVSKPSQTLV